MSKSPSLRRIQADVRELAIDPSDRYHAAPLEDDMFEWYVSVAKTEKDDCAPLLENDCGTRFLIAFILLTTGTLRFGVQKALTLKEGCIMVAFYCLPSIPSSHRTLCL